MMIHLADSSTASSNPLLPSWPEFIIGTILFALVFGHAIEAMARQPEATGRISLYMWIGFSLTEALALIGLVAPFIFKYS